jgi:hypothetical protein
MFKLVRHYCGFHLALRGIVYGVILFRIKTLKREVMHDPLNASQFEIVAIPLLFHSLGTTLPMTQIRIISHTLLMILCDCIRLQLVQVRPRKGIFMRSLELPRHQNALLAPFFGYVGFFHLCIVS